MAIEGGIPDKDRMTGEEIDQASTGLTGRARWHQAAKVAEDRAFGLGWEARANAEAKEAEEAAAAAADGEDQDDDLDVESPAYRRGFEAGFVAGAEPDDDPMVRCPGCNGSGKMWGYGTQCKRCFGATVVRASTLETEEAVEEEPVA